MKPIGRYRIRRKGPLFVTLRYNTSGQRPVERRVCGRPDLQPLKLRRKIRLALIGAGNFAKAMHLPLIAAHASRVFPTGRRYPPRLRGGKLGAAI